MNVHNGEAIFLPPEFCLWDIRQAAKQAARDGQPAQRFIITCEDFYYPQMLDKLLSNTSELKSLAMALGNHIVGEHNGMLRCAALWDTEACEGLLLRREGTALRCAYIPGITDQAANQEHMLAMRLAKLADHMQDISVNLNHGIEAGRHDMHDLLHFLSEQMDV